MCFADEGIRSIPPRKRKCIFPDESQYMKLHRNYSQGNCLLECSLRFAQNMQFNQTKTKPCTPWYFPFHDQGYRMCDPWETEQLVRIIANQASVVNFQTNNFNKGWVHVSKFFFFSLRMNLNLLDLYQ